MRGQALKQLVENKDIGVRGVCAKLQQLLSEGKLHPSDISVRELWESFIGPVSQTLEYSERHAGFQFLAEGATDSTAFASIMGQVLMARAMESYTQPAYIGDQLFDVIQTRRKTERMPGFTLQDNQGEVDEGMPYPESGMKDKYVSFESGKKRGVLLSITEEAVFLDETGMLLRRAADIGEFIRLNRETRMLDVFVGKTSNYYPDGVQTAIYAAGNGNVATTNALQDWTDIDAVMQVVAAQTDPEGNKILVDIRQLIVPWALVGTAARIMNATLLRVTTNTSNQTDSPGSSPLSPLFTGGMPSILTSPLLDGYTSPAPGTTTWFMGNGPRAFLYREHWPFQAFRRRQDTEAAWTQDVVEQFKFREWGTAHCVDHRHMYRSTA